VASGIELRLVTGAGSSTGRILPGSVEWPRKMKKMKKMKKMAANRSSSGVRSCRAVCATRPERAMPPRHAPMAADTFTFQAIPAAW